jgi:hypothetical protein
LKSLVSSHRDLVRLAENALKGDELDHFMHLVSEMTNDQKRGFQVHIGELEHHLLSNLDGAVRAAMNVDAYLNAWRGKHLLEELQSLVAQALGQLPKDEASLSPPPAKASRLAMWTNTSSSRAALGSSPSAAASCSPTTQERKQATIVPVSEVAAVNKLNMTVAGKLVQAADAPWTIMINGRETKKYSCQLAAANVNKDVVAIGNHAITFAEKAVSLRDSLVQVLQTSWDAKNASLRYTAKSDVVRWDSMEPCYVNAQLAFTPLPQVAKMTPWSRTNIEATLYSVGAPGELQTGAGFQDLTLVDERGCGMNARMWSQDPDALALAEGMQIRIYLAKVNCQRENVSLDMMDGCQIEIVQNELALPTTIEMITW